MNLTAEVVVAATQQGGLRIYTSHGRVFVHRTAAVVRCLTCGEKFRIAHGSTPPHAMDCNRCGEMSSVDEMLRKAVGETDMVWIESQGIEALLRKGPNGP